MTERKHFKQLVRGRMAKTGESYSTARRHLMRQASAPAPGKPFPHHFPGNIPVTTALRALLSHAGLRNPVTGAPYSEAMVFGFDGGIGAGVFAFHYAKEDFSSFFIAGRHAWQDDAHWGHTALKRLGLAFTVKESSGVKPGEKHLRDLLQGGRPVLTWVDASGLPYRALPGSFTGGSYHVVTVFGIDDAHGMAMVGDLADEVIPVSLKDLAVARGRIKKFKNRLLAVEPPSRISAELEPLVRGSIAQCVEDLTTCKMKNFTLAAFQGWAEKLDGSKAADSWEKIFRPGVHFYQGLRSITEYIEYYGTGGGLCRPIFAEFLSESASALKDPGLSALGERYARLGEAWSALAEAALPKQIPAFRETRELLARKWEALHAEGADAADAIKDCWGMLDAHSAKMKKDFPLDAEASTALRRELKRRVLALYEEEVAALEALGAWAG
jgi:hypothetical protein